MSREMWPYRDYVVSAFNHDLPYDQFIIEQLAGDELPNATQDQVVATGFLRNSMVNMEGAIDPEQFRMEAMFDRMDALGKSVLGLTVQCAQCHNHKYDPITQEDYYRLFAYLNDTNETNIAVYTPAEQKKRVEIFRKIRDLKRVTGFRLELLTDPNLPLGGPGRSPLGLFALSEFTVEFADPKTSDKKTKVKLVSATADFGNEEKPLEALFDDRTGKKRVTGP